MLVSGNQSVSLLVTCEHGGNRIPSRYRQLFVGHETLLRTHRGADFGALRLARELAASLEAPLLVSATSRLLIDLNRSPGHPKLYSEATRTVSQSVRDEIFHRYYLPYRAKAETLIEQAIANAMQVIHISCHSFTPVLAGLPRNADIGLLYDPRRVAEVEFSRRWRRAIWAVDNDLKVRMNYPYAGTADGFTVYLRRRFPEPQYVGIELEINQRHVFEGGEHWRRTRRIIIDSLENVTATGKEPAG